MGLLDALIYGVRDVLSGGGAATSYRRSKVWFRNGFTVTDDPVNERAVIDATASAPYHNAPITRVTDNYTVLSTDATVEIRTNTGKTIALPANPTDGDIYVVVNMAPGNNTLSGNGHNILGAASIPLAQYDSRRVQYDATNTIWLVI